MPKFFALHEGKEFEEFLADANFTKDYLLLEDVGEVVACGGWYVHFGIGGIAWGMVVNHKHGAGYGKFLLQKRLQCLREHVPQIKEVKLDTTQHVFTFFEQFGFVVVAITENGYAPGMHRYDMLLKL